MAVKRVNVLGRERSILVEIAGARGGQAGNLAHLFNQVRASQPRFKHVEHGEMDPSQSGHGGRCSSAVAQECSSRWPALFSGSFRDAAMRLS
jgi:hypothetical protein